MKYQEKVSTREDVRRLYERVKNQPTISQYRGYTQSKSYGWDEFVNDYIKADGELWFDNPSYDPNYFTPTEGEQTMNKQIEEMRNDVQEALKHNSAVDAIRHGLICVNSDGIARELFDDGYRRAADVVADVLEILSELKENYLADDDVREACAISYAEIKIVALKKKYESEEQV